MPTDLPERQDKRRGPSEWPDVAMLAIVCLMIVAIAWIVAG